jgi:hypothetical protein
VIPRMDPAQRQFEDGAYSGGSAGGGGSVEASIGRLNQPCVRVGAVRSGSEAVERGQRAAGGDFENSAKISFRLTESQVVP